MVSFSPVLVRPRRGRSATRRPAYRSRSRGVPLSPLPRKTTGGRRGRPRIRPRPRRPVMRALPSVPGVGGQLTYFKLGRPMKFYHKALLKNTSMQVHRSNRSARLEVTQGHQNVTSYAILRGGGYSNVSDNAYELPYLLNTASQNGINTTGVTTVQDALVTDTTRIFLHKVFSKYMITNQDIGNCQLHIYDVIVKRDYPSTAHVAFDAGIKDIGNNAWDSTQLGLMPWSSPEFNSYFKVLQKNSIILAQGQSHTHIVSYKPNKSIIAEILKSNCQSLKGYTIFTMIIAHGLPVNDQTTKTNVSTGSVSLDIVQTQDIHWTWMEKNKSNYTYVPELPLLTTEYEMNIGSGAPQADTQA